MTDYDGVRTESATDEMRRLLDERGVEWRGGLPTETIVREPIDVLYVERSDGMMHVYFRSYLTPEQAIAATLGAGTCHDKGNIERFICSECGCRLDLQDDDLEATMWLADGAAMVPRYCPNCGRRVVEVDDG
jgi:hypothetical protein